jgi:phosphoglycolate phosphatase-like HAD superfamily hydrolase
VLFDLDETLIDAEKGLRAAHATVAQIIRSHLQKDIAISSILKAMAQLDDEMNKCTKYDTGTNIEYQEGRMRLSPKSKEGMPSNQAQFIRQRIKECVRDDPSNRLSFLK